MAGWFRLRQNGLDILVRLTPKSSRDALGAIGVASDGSSHLAARVRDVPEKGEANHALERLVADCLGLPSRAVGIVSGSTSRLKTVRLTGKPDNLLRRLEAAIGTEAKPLQPRPERL